MPDFLKMTSTGKAGRKQDNTTIKTATTLSDTTKQSKKDSKPKIINVFCRFLMKKNIL